MKRNDFPFMKRNGFPETWLTRAIADLLEQDCVAVFQSSRLRAGIVHGDFESQTPTRQSVLNDQSDSFRSLRCGKVYDVLPSEKGAGCGSYNLSAQVTCFARSCQRKVAWLILPTPLSPLSLLS